MRNRNLKNVRILEEMLEKGSFDKDVLIALLNDYKKMIKRFERIISQSDAQQKQLLKLQEKLQLRNEKIKNLLDNADEGFLHVNEELIIDSEYSKKVLEIFHKDVSGIPVYELLYPDDAEKALFFKETLHDIINSEGLKSEVLLSLLNKEFLIDGKFINVKYKKLGRSFMLILTDVTEKKALERKAELEALKLKMIVAVVSSTDQFLEIKFSYENFALEINGYKKIEKLHELKAKVHTYKGLFAQMNFIHTVEKLHEFEDEIIQSIKKGQIVKALSEVNTQVMLSWLKRDLEIIKEVMGEDFFSFNDKICINKEDLKFSYYTSLKNCNGNVADNLKKFTYFNVCKFLAPFKTSVKELSERFGKEAELNINCNNVFLPDIYKNFLLSLIHVLRNAVDHGIEEEFERIDSGKKIVAQINMDVKIDKSTLIVKICDDGRGIRIKNFKGQNVTDEKDIMALIFQDGYTTKSSVDSVSGRGTGLYAVKNECEKLGGKIEIKNEKGACFIFKIPLIENENKEFLSDLLLTCARRYFEKFVSYQEVYESSCELDDENTVFIDLNGDIKETIFLSADGQNAYHLAKNFIHSDNEKFIKDHIRDVMAETLNILAGYLISELKRYNINTDISVPYFGKCKCTVFKKEIISEGFKITLGVKV